MNAKTIKVSCLGIIFLLAAGLLFLLARPLLSSANDYGWYKEGDYLPDRRIRLELVNTLNQERKDCPIIIPRDKFPVCSLEPLCLVVVDPSLPSKPRASLEELKAIGSGALLDQENGQRIPSQCDDLNKDGIWDELFFVLDFKPYEKKTVFIYIGNENYRGGIPHETHAGMGYYGRHLVPWWESKFMGWKLWYPDGIDLYGKRKPMLVANMECSGEISGYTAPYEYGADIMTVSESFGAGGLCLFDDPSRPNLVSRPRQSLSRGKGPIHSVRFAYEVIANGPLRSIIRQHIMNWQTGRGVYELYQFFTAYKGQSYSTVQVKFLKFLPDTDWIKFGCGVRKLPWEYKVFKNDKLAISFAKNCVISDPDVDPAWETKTVVDFMGIAIIIKDKYESRYQFIEEYEGNHIMVIEKTDDLIYEYLIAAGWSQGTVNRDEMEFKNYVRNVQKQYNNPISIRSVKLELKKN